MKMLRLLAGSIISATAVSSAVMASPTKSFRDEVKFLRQHVRVVTLSDARTGARVAIVPGYQGRVMTSSSGGNGGASYGWINHELISSGKRLPHMNAFGGEDRFWLGPEGGQFGLFFKKGAKFDLAHWFTPASVDTRPFGLTSLTRASARFHQNFSVTNFSGARFDVGVDRRVRLLSPAVVWSYLGVRPARGVKMVAYQTENRITNRGRRTWNKRTGLLSIWILGMFNPAPTTTIVIPFKPGVQPGPVVNDTYFGKVPSNRLVVKKNVLFFKGDGKYRSKIGIAPRRARPILGSYDADAGVLTLVQFTSLRPAGNYVNSMWEIQKKPFGGDVVNSYNDGPPSPGAKPLGPFYELETSSSAAALSPGASAVHIHRTIHMQGPKAELDRVARAALGVSLHEISTAFGGADTTPGD